ncbi:MAG: Ig-like domain-containing protein [Clostridia bacterium]|nr:Ig-like domain-containing protein [Clostridia bacterium]
MKRRLLSLLAALLICALWTTTALAEFVEPEILNDAVDAEIAPAEDTGAEGLSMEAGAVEVPEAADGPEAAQFPGAGDFILQEALDGEILPGGEDSADLPPAADLYAIDGEDGDFAAEGDQAVLAEEMGEAADSLSPRLYTTQMILGVKETRALAGATSYTYTSQNPAIATVSATGVVTSKKTGTTTIVVTNAFRRQSTCTVTVKKAPKKVTLKPKKLSLPAKTTALLTASLPKNTASAITYTSSNPAVATVGPTGIVTGVSTGKATITAKAFNGKKATCKVTVTHERNYAINYRALLIGEGTFPNMGSSRSLPAKKNISMMEKMLRSVKGPMGNGWSITTRLDRTAYQVQNDISAAFAGATSNDVSLFYISTHGNSGVRYTQNYYSAGALSTYAYGSGVNAISLHQLARWLNAIPGRVIVIIDACGSGSAVYNAKAAGRFDGAAFDQSVVDAFSELDVGVMAPGDHDMGAFVLTNKFFVLTSAADGEWGWSNAKKGHFFTQWLTAGVKTKGKMPADSSKNKYLTLHELYKYTSKKANKTWIRSNEDGRRYKQHVQVYPANSGFELFYRK